MNAHYAYKAAKDALDSAAETLGHGAATADTTMDHSTMDHGGMDHGGMGDGDSCNMSMLFTWNTKNLCLVFEWWHVRTTPGLIFSLLAVVALAAGYEALRKVSRTYEASVAKKASELPNEDTSTETTPRWLIGKNALAASKRAHMIKAILYAVQNFYAFMLMLLFMTYNGWVMIAVSVGAFVGYFLFGANTEATKDGACH